MRTSAAAKWISPESDKSVVELLSAELGIHDLTAQLLVNRGFHEVQSARDFLNPTWDTLHDPFLLPDMDKAARRIVEALDAKERIFIHGDYDVDGVTSTALYVRALKALGGDVIYRVPHRKADGYDLKTKSLDWAHQQGASLVITSDCGIQARGPVDHANGLGMVVIVTDHHEPGEVLPDAYAVVNPHRKDSTYPFEMLAGVAVAYKTMQAVVRVVQPQHERAFLERFVDLVACGTIADVMPLVGENRVFARFGLAAMASTKKVGLRALIAGAGIDTSRPLSSESVGFGIGPRINAVGRLDDAAVALDLLLTNDIEEANTIVRQLNALNIERQNLQRDIVKHALELLSGKDMDSTLVIVLAAQGWNSGVVGIVAGKLVEMFSRPAIVIGMDDAMVFGKGSARSIPGFDLFSNIKLCEHLLQNCGGHEMAAGLSLCAENLELFDAAINAQAASVLSLEDLVPKMNHDGDIDSSLLSISLLEQWSEFAPFGQANPEPRFSTKDLVLCESRRIGKDSSHLKMKVRSDAMRPTDCVAWGRGELADTLMPGQSLEALYIPQINEWNGQKSVQFNIKDIRLG